MTGKYNLTEASVMIYNENAQKTVFLPFLGINKAEDPACSE
jgi:hypothetical protein